MGRRQSHILTSRGRLGVVTSIAAMAGLSAAALAAGTTLTTEQVKPGKVLVTSSHRALYMFTKDSASRSACSGSCAKAWPALAATGRLSVAPGRGLNPKLLGTIKGQGGRPQVTYNHHPLYMFAADKHAGDIKGEGLSAFGGHWYLVGPSGNAVKPKGSHPVCNGVCQSY